MTHRETTYSALKELRYRYTEIVPRTFLFGKNSQSWDHENVFSGQSIRRFILDMSTNAGFVDAKTTNPFRSQLFV